MLKKINKIPEAKECFEAALKLDNQSYLAKYNLSLLLLHQKDYELGWREYESRFYVEKTPAFTKDIPKLEKFDNRDKIFIWGEQGIGDQVFFASMLRFVDPCLDITVGLDKRLVSIFERSFQNLKFSSLSDKKLDTGFTKQISIGSLGNFVGNKNLEKFKALDFLKPDQGRKKFFKKEICNNGKFICGISWRSLNKKTGRWRSLTLDQLVPFFKKNNFHYIDLQYDDTVNELQHFEDKYGIKIQSISNLDKYNDIDGMFSLIDCCDLVLTIDNSIAHFAGSIGKSTLMMLPFGVGSIWYWHDDIISTWYPSIKIFRQAENSDWDHLVKKITNEFEFNF